MSITEIQANRSPMVPRITGRRGWTFVIISHLQTWIERSRNRREYEKLLRHSDKILFDVGVSRIQLLREVNKPFWRA